MSKGVMLPLVKRPAASLNRQSRHILNQGVTRFMGVPGDH